MEPPRPAEPCCCYCLQATLSSDIAASFSTSRSAVGPASAIATFSAHLLACLPSQACCSDCVCHNFVLT